MGAQFFEHRRKSTSPERGFKELINEADYLDGHDCYNGSINTTYLDKTVKIADKYSEKSDKLAEKWMDEHEMTKRACVCLDLGVVEYVSYKNTKKTYSPPKPSMKFVVYSSLTDSRGKEFKTLALARKYASEMVSKGMDYVIKKEYGSSLIESSCLKKTVHKKKTKGAAEYHMYLYCGWAAC